jgi:hypothetical protein
MTKQLLWLDDVRDPQKNDWLVFSPIGRNVDTHWVTSYTEFVDWIMIYGLPDGICFDHDLGMEHTKWYFDNGGHNSPPDPSNADFVMKTGFDCAKFLVDYCMTHDLDIPPYGIQSANPVGKQNIDMYLKNYIKFRKEND